MPERELQSSAPSRSVRQAVRRQPEATETQQPPLARSAPLGAVLARLGNSSSVHRQAAILKRATASRPARATAVWLQLQRQYGNRHVQQVVALARQTAGQTETTAELDTAIQRARGGGQPLDTGARTRMESAFGANFSGVRIHTNAAADALNQSLQAHAFTTGQDIFFRQGGYSPGSSSGRELLAHELAHVVQQRGSQMQRKLTISQPGDVYEREADQVAQAIVQQEYQAPPVEASGGGVQRQMANEEEEEV